LLAAIEGGEVFVERLRVQILLQTRDGLVLDFRLEAWSC
jgi:hypothetical protein